MARIEIEELEIDEAAADKFWVHGISTDQVEAVLDHRWVTTRNRAGRAAPYILLGRDNQGRCLALPIVATDHPHIWRPITAWYCKPSEAAKLR